MRKHEASAASGGHDCIICDEDWPCRAERWRRAVEMMRKALEDYANWHSMECPVSRGRGGPCACASQFAVEVLAAVDVMLEPLNSTSASQETE